MIDKKTFTREWIEDRSNHFKTGKSKGNGELIEKVINALYLLEKLVSSGINMIFKGGTYVAVV